MILAALLQMNPMVLAQQLQVDTLLGNDSIANRPLILMTALAGLALVPFVLMMVTSFVKIAVVLSIARQAIGTQQIPPTTVITGLSIILTVYTMSPIMEEGYRRAAVVAEKAPGGDLLNVKNIGVLQQALQEGIEPMRRFLKRHAHRKDREMFYALAKRMRKAEDRAGVDKDDYLILIPSFVISELTEAFQIGFIIFLPFLVIDMVVASVLMSLGMMMLSPMLVAMPFKLLLFVLVDGWTMTVGSLVATYVV